MSARGALRGRNGNIEGTSPSLVRVSLLSPDGKVVITEDVRSKSLQDSPQAVYSACYYTRIPKASSTQPPVADVNHLRKCAIE